MSARVIYEVDLQVDREIADEYDLWLREHVEEMLALPGIEHARVVVPDGDAQDPARAHRTVFYTLTNRSAFDNYLEHYAEAMRADGTNRFGNRFSASRRVFEETPSANAEPHCLNCDAVLTGQYCGSCGQRAESRLISLWQLTRDALGDLLDVDSRFWRTIRSLLTRPGHLTNEYLQGRRARYMPPFRTYLVLSVLFFVTVTFDPDISGGLLDPISDISVDTVENGSAATSDAGVAAALETETGFAGDDTVVLTFDGEGDKPDCDKLLSGAPQDTWRQLNRSRATAICEGIVNDSGRGLLRQFVDLLPTTLIVLLPLLALALKLLYPLSRRYYVEHLLFVVHFQAFVFLLWTLEHVAESLIALLPGIGGIAGLVTLAASLYTPVYLYRAMRSVYWQGRAVTAIKFLTLVCAYSVAAGLLVGVVFLFSALSL